MDDEPTSPAQQWLIKAEHDLASARRLGSGQEPIPDTAAYHCQQAGEKALKAVLAWKGAALRMTHDLRVLLDALVGELPDLESLRDAAELLTPYATAYRYPGDPAQPGEDELQEALEAAERVFSAAEILLAQSAP